MSICMYSMNIEIDVHRDTFDESATLFPCQLLCPVILPVLQWPCYCCHYGQMDCLFVTKDRLTGVRRCKPYFTNLLQFWVHSRGICDPSDRQTHSVSVRRWCSSEMTIEINWNFSLWTSIHYLVICLGRSFVKHVASGDWTVCYIGAGTLIERDAVNDDKSID